MKTWDIRWRLTLWYTLVVICILVGFASAMLVMLRSHLYQRDDQVMVEELRELVEEFSRWKTDSELTRQLQQRFDVHSHYYFQVLTANHEILFQSRFLSLIQLPVPEHP